MNDELRQLIQDKLSSEGFLEENWSSLVMAACDGQEAVETLLLEAETETKTSPQAATMNKTAAYITSLTVQGFRGIGPKQALRFSPGPGLTIVVGRNGSGKSSFAEALEVLFSERATWVVFRKAPRQLIGLECASPDFRALVLKCLKVIFKRPCRGSTRKPHQ